MYLANDISWITSYSFIPTYSSYIPGIKAAEIFHQQQDLGSLNTLIFIEDVKCHFVTKDKARY